MVSVHGELFLHGSCTVVIDMDVAKGMDELAWLVAGDVGRELP